MNAWGGTFTPPVDDPDGSGASVAEAAANAVGDGDAPAEPITGSPSPGTTRSARPGASVTAAGSTAPREPAITEPADPRDPAAVERMRQRLADEEKGLAEHRRRRGTPGQWYRRGFVKDTITTIRRIKLWLDLAAAKQY